MKFHDYLIIGSGLFGTMFVWLARQVEKRCIVIDKRLTLVATFIVKTRNDMLFDTMMVERTNRKVRE